MPVVRFGDVEPRLDTNDFVEGLLTRGGFSVVFGEPACRKTFFMTNLGFHVATGRRWWGPEVDKCQSSMLLRRAAMESRTALRTRSRDPKRIARLRSQAKRKPRRSGPLSHQNQRKWLDTVAASATDGVKNSTHQEVVFMVLQLVQSSGV
ncbi:MAG: AAA family ATPase [Gemmatimonadetes bacterium]|nr:AAA family ATPase [Gemmatimonadota bacterium]